MSLAEKSTDIFKMYCMGGSVAELSRMFGFEESEIRRVTDPRSEIPSRDKPALRIVVSSPPPPPAPGPALVGRRRKMVACADGEEPDPYTPEEAHWDCFIRKRNAAIGGKWGWDLRFEDIEFPTHCPVLGFELDWSRSGVVGPATPSFDRINSSKGYTKGNVRVISVRANILKGNGTSDEHARIAAYIKKSLTD